MAVLVCDLCGGKIVMGSGGTGVCSNCGMEYSTERLREKLSEGGATVAAPVAAPQADNSKMIENYLKMAENALSAENNEEAESYCNKIIEIDVTNYRAWLIKGQAAGWQSTLRNPRLSESVSAFAKAIENAPEDEKEAVKEEAVDQITRLTNAMLSLRTDNFAKNPCEENKNAIVSDLKEMTHILKQFFEVTGIFIDPTPAFDRVPTNINNAAVDAFDNVILPEYKGDPNDPDDRANKYEWQRFIEKTDYCIGLLGVAIAISKDDKTKITCYKNAAYYQQMIIDSCSWKRDYSSYGGSYWNKEWMLTDSAKQIRRNKIAEYNKKIAELENAKKEEERAEEEAKRKAEEEARKAAEEEAKKRFEEYWAEHAEEKKTLEEEAASLKKQVSELETELENVPEKAEKDEASKQLRSLLVKRESLGIFKIKEKKAIQEEIDTVSAKVKTLEGKVNAAQKTIREKIDPLNKRINEINNELTKAR